MAVAISMVKFPKKGKGVSGQTYSAFVFGVPKFSDLKDEDGNKIGEKFITLQYDEIIKGAREAEVLKFVDEAKFSRIEVMMRGYDAMRRLEASGGTNLENSLIARLRLDGVRGDVADEKQRNIRLGAIARSILADVREMGENLDDVYAQKTKTIIEKFGTKPAEEKAEDEAEDADDEE